AKPSGRAVAAKRELPLVWVAVPGFGAPLPGTPAKFGVRERAGGGISDGVLCVLGPALRTEITYFIFMYTKPSIVAVRAVGTIDRRGDPCNPGFFVRFPGFPGRSTNPRIPGFFVCFPAFPGSYARFPVRTRASRRGQKQLGRKIGGLGWRRAQVFSARLPKGDQLQIFFLLRLSYDGFPKRKPSRSGVPTMYLYNQSSHQAFDGKAPISSTHGGD
ncbi:MAG: hypothetical protein BJ554DRAFT_3626, partial [Olpidium bornovanus]